MRQHRKTTTVNANLLSRWGHPDKNCTYTCCIVLGAWPHCKRNFQRPPLKQLLLGFGSCDWPSRYAGPGCIMLRESHGGNVNIVKLVMSESKRKEKSAKSCGLSHEREPNSMYKPQLLSMTLRWLGDMMCQGKILHFPDTLFVFACAIQLGLARRDAQPWSRLTSGTGGGSPQTARCSPPAMPRSLVLHCVPRLALYLLRGCTICAPRGFVRREDISHILTGYPLSAHQAGS